MIVLSSQAGKRQPGRIEISYMPRFGRLDVMIFKPNIAFGRDASDICIKCVGSLAAWDRPNFAYVDIYDNAPSPEEPGDKTSYRASLATFPHRQCLGWMAYVAQVVTKQQLPLAADIVPVKGGSIIVAVDEPFDLANKEHIKRANQIEMDMNDLGLLAVIDPTF
ncbi:Imm52 family immunity protein [Xanthomonas populi]|uniref:Uncharacterized protein n=2 Tax=Xanthomonas populi TaxID=53414 RepID=A0A2S7EPD2_9XANT|nr:hypothetical protein XpopCFBP1817_10215 [Xanthomonas populi]